MHFWCFFRLGETVLVYFMFCRNMDATAIRWASRVLSLSNITVAQPVWECFFRTVCVQTEWCVSQGTERKDSKHNTNAPKRPSKGRSVTLEDEDWNWEANKKAALNGGSNLTRSGSVKDLIYRFDGTNGSLPRLGSLKVKSQDVSGRDTGKMRHESKERGKNQNPVSSGEISDAKSQEASEQKRPAAEKTTEFKTKHTKDGQKNRSTDSPDASVPGPVSPVSDGRAASLRTSTRLTRSNLSITRLISSCTLDQSTPILTNQHTVLMFGCLSAHEQCDSHMVIVCSNISFY